MIVGIAIGFAWHKNHHSIDSVKSSLVAFIHPPAPKKYTPHSSTQIAVGTTPAPSGLYELIVLTRSVTPQTPQAERVKLVMALAALGDGAVKDIGSALARASTKEARAVLADALARSGTGHSVEELIRQAAQLPVAAERASLASTFANVTSEEGIEALISGLAATEDPAIVGALVAAISHAANGRTVGFLMALYREPPSVPMQRKSVSAALSSIQNPEATDALARIISHASELELIESAAQSLARIGTPRALEALMDGLRRVGESDHDLRKTLLNALAMIDNSDATSALIGLTTPNPSIQPDVAQAATRALQTMKTRSR